MYPWISRTLDFWLQFCEKKCGLYMDVYGTSGVLLGLPACSFSLFAILALPAITISDSILAIDVTLDRSKRTFALYIDLDTSTSLHDGRNRKLVYYDNVLTMSTILCEV